MSTSQPASENHPFDVSRIRQLVKLMREHDLSEIDLRHENSRICLRRGDETPAASERLIEPVAHVRAAAAQPAMETTAIAQKSEAAATTISITSPIVGTFFAASSPDAEAFVKVGSKVTAETIVCIVEAMKVFNEIPAGVTGTIAQVLVENGEPVEYGQPLFRVEP